jgi:hypothetical protein
VISYVEFETLICLEFFCLEEKLVERIDSRPLYEMIMLSVNSISVLRLFRLIDGQNRIC